MRSTPVLLAASVLVALGAAILGVYPSSAEFSGGGGQVEVSNTVQTEARIVGQSVDVAIIGTVALDAASLDTLTNATALGNCTYVAGDPTATIGTTAANIPASPMASRTAMTVWNHSTAPANYLLCNAGGTATTTAGVRIEAGHQFRKWEGLGGGTVLSCRCVTGTCTYGIEEERCYQ